VDYQLREGESEADALKEENLRARVSAILADIGHTKPWELEWWSVYSANTLCLDDYRHGRVFFIGDAAHIVPIFGVRGLNNGLADAENIGWKLALVLHGEADARLLDSYSPERRGATLDVFANATKSTRFMTPPTRGYRRVRDAALALAVRSDLTRPLINPRQSQPYTYAASPLTSQTARDKEFQSGPVAGAPIVNQRLGDNDYLLDRLGPGFTGLYFSAQGIAPAAVSQLAGSLALGNEPFKLLVLAGSQAMRAYGASDGSFYLVRPDRHVAARWCKIELAEVRDAFQQALGRGPA
jgi:3-(3-hydroxy-phenyl)propionate hydroxylase